MELGRALLLASALLCAGCASNAVVHEIRPPPDPKTLMPALENRIYDLIADERRKLDPNAKVLALDSELVGVARAKSSDMARLNYLAHTSPEGKTSASIIMDYDAGFQGLLGENIAEQHYLKAYAIDVDVFAHRFVDLWLASKSHRENIAYPAFDRTGIGAAVNSDGIYVTELFATDLGLSSPTPQGSREDPNAP